MEYFVLQTRVLNESHTSGILSDLLIECAKEWKLTRPGTDIPVTTDNARNVVNSVRDAKGFGPNVRCFAHTINLACKKSLQTTTLSRLLGKIRKVVTYFHHSSYGAQVLKSKQAVLELPLHSLIIDVSTRWNSTYDMLERYYEQHEAVLLSTIEIKKKNKDLVTLTDDDLSNVKVVAETLKPLKTVTKLLCSEQTPTISIILPLKHKIIESVESDTKILREVKYAILEDLKPRYTEPELLKFLEESTALDPRFRSLPFSEYDENTNFAVYSRLMAKSLQYSKDRKVCDDNETETIALLTDGLDSEEPPKKKTALEELLGDTFSKTSTSTCQLDDLQHEIKTYQEGIKTPLDSSPLSWWAANESQFPQLSLQARKYLGIPGTSVPSERVFSTAGDIVSAQRNCLHPDNVDILIFLKNNFNLP